MMKVVISIGLGRLHLMSSAEWLAKAGIDISMICGWVPRNSRGWMVRVCSRIVGRDLSYGMAKRLTAASKIRIISMPIADFFDQGLRVMNRILFRGRFHGAVSHVGWSIFGYMSRRHLKGAEIFHCRAGAGQAGAIAVARRRGLKVLVDQSALHPGQTEQNLKEDYERWGQKLAIAPNYGVWKNVVADCKDADMVLVNAEHIRDSFVSRGIPPEKLRIVRLGVREDFHGLKKTYEMTGCVKILFTGGFSILKGAEYALEAIRILKDRGLDARFDVVGSVAIPEALKNKYSDVNIVYHGVLPQDDLKTFLSECDYYLFPSLADGCAQSGMEALAAGLPVVATYQSGLPITDGETGCVVPMKDPLAIADKIEWLNRHDADRERIGRAAARLIRENYTWEKYAENVKKVYEELLAQ